MRIVVISQLPPPVHGSTVMTSHFLSSLQAAGLDHKLVERRFSDSLEQIGSVSGKKVISFVGLAVRLIRTTAHPRPSACVHFVTNRPASFIADLLLTLLLRLARIPRILYIHTSGFERLAARGAVWRLLVKTLFRNAQVVVCLGARLVADISPWVDPARVRIIPNMSPPANETDGASGGEFTSPRVVFLSNWLREKGLMDFLRAAERIARERDDVCFVAAGAPADASVAREAEAFISESGLAARIDLVGAVDERGRASLFRSASLLMFPSTYSYEAQPLTIVEAMSYGVPTLAYDVGGLADVVQSGVTGLLVPAGRYDQLADEAIGLLGNRAALAHLAASALETWKVVHSPEAYGELWKGVLGDLL